MMKADTPERQLAGFIAKFSPENAALIRAVFANQRPRRAPA
jgi:hypothetical protein